MPGNMLIGLDSAKDQVFLWGAECLQELMLTKGAEGRQYLLKAYGARETCAHNERPKGIWCQLGQPRGTWQSESHPRSWGAPAQHFPRQPRGSGRATPRSASQCGALGQVAREDGLREETKAVLCPSTRSPALFAAGLEAIPALLSPVSCGNTGQKSCCPPAWWERQTFSSGASRSGEGDPHILPTSSNSE